MIYWLLCDGKCNDRALLADVRQYRKEAIELKHKFGRQANPHARLTQTLRLMTYTKHRPHKRKEGIAVCMTCHGERCYG